MRSIVVGVDGSSQSEAALDWAITLAEITQATVVALIGWVYLVPINEGHGVSVSPTDRRDRTAALAASVDRVVAARGGTDVEIEQRVVQATPELALVQASQDADLVVVGTRGNGGFKGLLLGSVSRKVVEHASCPVLVHRNHEPS